MSRSEINLDFDRGKRIGFDEAIFCESKSVAQLNAILDLAQDRGSGFLLTRLGADVYANLTTRHQSHIDYDPVSRTGFFGEHKPSTQSSIAIVTAGTSDIPVSREAARTLEYSGHTSNSFADVGVAGLWRLLERIDEIRKYPVIIVVAGMDGALPSVLCGLVSSLVIAVPTSVGYGVAEGGRTALNAMLASCAPGLLVVNIDNGYGAACAALRALAALRIF
ncbi:nickel pincer cofactor biosynthesis protein LarB [Paralcaligenes ureilyticus]|uniref:PurE domain-containing protein n=1 Tax=Paralcaligenes ureilyticus TaxID=627131 RepID=A0A4R3LV61_9BURK|nr:nickel pincer cofactor biosynthesis protein LarB [Paralcaligenes ureilyticus]TCT02307.1 hypothetical protein EDC26_11933 [Paralcaligenes ureilyticus]